MTTFCRQAPRQRRLWWPLNVNSFLVGAIKLLSPDVVEPPGGAHEKSLWSGSRTTISFVECPPQPRRFLLILHPNHDDFCWAVPAHDDFGWVSLPRLSFNCHHLQHNFPGSRAEFSFVFSKEERTAMGFTWMNKGWQTETGYVQLVIPVLFPFWPHGIILASCWSGCSSSCTIPEAWRRANTQEGGVEHGYPISESQGRGGRISLLIWFLLLCIFVCCYLFW